MKQLFALFVLLALPQLSQATDKDQACTAYSNAAVYEEADDVRLRLAAEVLVVAYDLPYESADLEETLAAKIKTGKIVQDGVEKMAYFACVTDLTDEDKTIAQQAIETVMKP